MVLTSGKGPGKTFHDTIERLQGKLTQYKQQAQEDNEWADWAEGHIAAQERDIQALKSQVEDLKFKIRHQE